MKPRVIIAACVILLAYVAGTYLIVDRHNDVPYRPWVDVYLHGDQLTQLSDGSIEDQESWESFLGRTPRLTEAWSEVEAANGQWKAGRQVEAFNLWRQTANDDAE